MSSTNNNTDLLRSYIQRLGLEPKIADLYLALQTYGPQTISDLARNSSVARIHIYRLLDDIKATGLIEIETQYKRSVLHAAPITKIQVLLAKKEQELKDLQRDYAALASQLTAQTLHSATTRVQFYEGLDGIKQMLWCETKGTGENLSILYDNMQNKTNLSFFERWAHECNKRELHFRSIIGDHFLQTQRNWYAKHSNERLQNWQGRYIPETIFPISYTLVVFDDTVLHYNWQGQRMFGVQIEDAAIARAQRQFFEMLWERSEPMPATGLHPQDGDSGR